MSHLRRTLLKSLLLFFLFGIILIPVHTATSSDSNITPVNDNSETATESEKETNMEGWKEARYENFYFSIPEDWLEESGISIWYPPTESFATGFPKISLQCGAMPVMSGQTVDGQLKELIHGNNPTSKTPVTICNMQGHLREVQGNYGVRHLALTLEQDVPGDMIMVTFFNCRVPNEEYEKYKDIFEKILDSVHCK